MTTYEAGDARLSIYPDASQFKKRLEADLAKIKIEYAVDVSADTTKASSELDAFRARESGKSVTVKADVETSTAERKIDELGKKIKGLGEGGGGIGGALLANGGAAAIASLPAAAVAIATVAASMQQLAGASLALPGALGGALSTFATVKVGLVGIKDAFTALDKASDGSWKSIDAANEALSKIAPSAAEAVKAASQLKDELKSALVIPVQQNLFDGLAVSAKRLYAADLPNVKNGMLAVSTAVNGAVKQLGASLGSDSSKSFIDRIFGNTAAAQTKATAAIDPIVHAVGTLASAGSSSLPRLADALARVSERFDHFISAADSDGRLSKWIDDGLTGLGHLGDTFLNIGKAFTSISDAAGTGGLLKTLDDLSGKLATFLKSDQGQADLKKFFQEGRETLAKWGPILENIVGMFPGLYQGSKEWTDAILPPLKEITGFLAQHPALIQGVATAFIAWKSIEGITSLISSLGKVSELLGSEGGKGGKGGAGILGKLALAGALKAGIDSAGPDVNGPNPPSASDSLGNLGTNTAGDAAAGFALGGVPGAAIGSVLGVGETVVDRASGDLARQKAQAQKAQDDWRKSHPYVPPTTSGPSADDLLLQAIRSGQVPGASIGPDGRPRDPDGKILPGYANGGITPGYSPGRDNMLVPMSGGEGVIIPTVTRQLGPAGIKAINSGALTRGFWNGGVVPEDGPGGPNPFDPNPVPPGGIPHFPGSLNPFGPAGGGAPLPAMPGSLGGLLDAPPPAPYQPGGPAPVAANPSGPGTGSVGGIFNRVLSGLQGPINNGLAALNGAAAAGGGGGGGGLGTAIPGIGGDGAGFGGGNGIADPFSSAGNGLLSSALGGLTSGIPGLGGLGSLFGGGGNGSPMSFGDRFATTPGLFGLLGSMGSSDPSGNLMNWGEKTGQWLGNFTAKTVGGFGTALWQGGLDFFGLGNSILSPNNSWNKAGQSVGQFAFGADGPLGRALGANNGAGSGGGKGKKPPSAAQMRDANEKIQRADQQVALIKQRISEQGSHIPPSQRQALQNELQKATQEAADARQDYGTMATGQMPATLGRGGASFAGVGSAPPVGAGAARWTPQVQAALQAVGARYGITNIPAWTNAIVGQIQTESNGDPGAFNGHDSNGHGGTQQVYGLGQFLPSTFKAHNITGGSINDGNAQIYAMIDYVSKQYGQNAAGVPNYINQGHGYAKGGVLPGYSPGVDNMLVPLSGGEGIIIPAVTRALGPEGIKAINGGALTKGYAEGGIFPASFTQPTPPPPPPPSFAAAAAAQANTMNAPQQGDGQSANAGHLNAPTPGPAPVAPAAPPTAAQPDAGSQAFTPGVGAAPVGGPAPTGDALNHNLAAINTGIDSGAAAIGQAVSTAIGIAGAGAGMFGGGAIGAAGPYIAGLIKEGGKVAKDVVNVGSSFLVGSVPGDIKQGPAYGETLNSPQNVPNTATDNRRNYVFNGIDGSRIVDDIRLKDAQDSQGELARFRG